MKMTRDVMPPLEILTQINKTSLEPTKTRYRSMKRISTNALAEKPYRGPFHAFFGQWLVVDYEEG